MHETDIDTLPIEKWKPAWLRGVDDVEPSTRVIYSTQTGVVRASIFGDPTLPNPSTDDPAQPNPSQI